MHLSEPCLIPGQLPTWLWREEKPAVATAVVPDALPTQGPPERHPYPCLVEQVEAGVDVPPHLVLVGVASHRVWRFVLRHAIVMADGLSQNSTCWAIGVACCGPLCSCATPNRIRSTVHSEPKLQRQDALDDGLRKEPCEKPRVDQRALLLDPRRAQRKRVAQKARLRPKGRAHLADQAGTISVAIVLEGLGGGCRGLAQQKGLPTARSSGRGDSRNGIVANGWLADDRRAAEGALPLSQKTGEREAIERDVRIHQPHGVVACVGSKATPDGSHASVRVDEACTSLAHCQAPRSAFTGVDDPDKGGVTQLSR